MRLTHDRRGQSVVVGTVILFGFLILALSLYQVQVVPQQNGQTEFEHFEAVQNDLIEVRSAVSTASQSERPQFPTVKLGTNYQTRLLAINPPSPSGSLRTSQAYNITIEDETGRTANVSTRFLQYRPGYNELDAGPTWYENSVLYLDERGRGSGTVIIEDQNVVTDDDTVRVTALQNEFQRGGTGRITLELYPTSGGETLRNLSGNLTVSVPTRLTGEEYWSARLSDGSTDAFVRVENDSYDAGVHELVLNTTVEDFQLNSVGIQSEPNGDVGKLNTGPSSPDSDTPDEFVRLNASVQETDQTNTDKPKSVTIDLFETNSGASVTFTASEANNDSATDTVLGPSGSDIVLDLGSAGNNDYPIVVTANINGGECLETTFNASDGPKTIEDWSQCNG